MRNLNHIVEEYLSSDAERRLYLFLDCPLLREEFMEIERKEAILNHTQISNESLMGKILETLVSLFPSSLKAKLKRCC